MVNPIKNNGKKSNKATVGVNQIKTLKFLLKKNTKNPVKNWEPVSTDPKGPEGQWTFFFLNIFFGFFFVFFSALGLLLLLVFHHLYLRRSISHFIGGSSFLFVRDAPPPRRPQRRRSLTGGLTRAPYNFRVMYLNYSAGPRGQGQRTEQDETLTHTHTHKKHIFPLFCFFSWLLLPPLLLRLLLMPFVVEFRKKKRAGGLEIGRNPVTRRFDLVKVRRSLTTR